MLSYILSTLFIVAFISTLIVLLFQIKKNKNLQSQNFTLQNLSQSQKELITSLKLELNHSLKNLEETQNSLLAQKNELKEQYTQNLEKLENKYNSNLATLKEELTQNFSLQNKALFAQNQNQINEDSKKLLNEIFSPLKEEIQNYNKRLLENQTSVKTSIENMFKYSNAMSENAQKLAQILKGDKKVRGNFGEIQLKSVLQNSGLIEGEHYKLQEQLSFEGSRYIPDAIIYLEKDKSIIIDAKFSLPSDFSFEEVGLEVKDELAKNLCCRIEELSKKPYHKLSSYDFVLLFIPYQNILDLALEAKPSLYQYAYDKKIYLTTPHTLFMALKTIQITWINMDKSENVSQSLQEIEKFYEKFLGIVEDCNKIAKLKDTLCDVHQDLAKKLTEGRGNLESRFQKLGIYAKKEIDIKP
ncbi:DNA recombination protein RmuC [Helicobacter cholecystus]|uniref:DNA recombination protein RmuC n=1 Tax=Helicobacter cholecystus TaxID=45498 RepID=A0A3D8IU02_9HELI|nr:DNA recombination protein RmuC [Helicobacter cholecystus]RDU68777.1 DNA recombination protein RmuC [Helicobacter cholecystus]VEJ23945.1 DNA recombination protein [Helicobacter cholecystus]